MKRFNIIVFALLIGTIFSGCNSEDGIELKNIFDEVESTDPLDVYLKNEFRDPYGSVVIYKFIDRYLDPTKSAVPPRKEVVKPVAELIKKAWIKPYSVASDQGDDFLKRYFPAELVFVGSPLYNGDGTITLGTADAGVRVTLTQVNDYTPDNEAWILQSFRTLHHEFAHIIDQNFNFDNESFYDISGSDYTSPGSWTLENLDSAITKGMVTPYGTSAVGEDFAELISYIITTDPVEFDAIYITADDCTDGSAACIAKNEGKLRIKQKYDIVVKYMKEDVGIDLLVLRDEFLNSVN